MGSNTTKDFKKYYSFTVPPEEVYFALTNENSLKLWTGEPATMKAEPETEFSLWDNSITGKNLEFVENKKIVQRWYFDEASDNSIVTILIHPDKQGCSVEVRHSNIPQEDYESIVEGWDEIYFNSLKEFLED